MFEIKNVKISLKLEDISLNTVIEYLTNNNIKFQIKSNYIIINHLYVYIIFKRKNLLINHVNVTKIPNLNKVEDSVKNFTENIFKDLKIIVKKVNIDNLTSIYHIKKGINLSDIIKKENNNFKILYNNEKFPGMFLKFKVGTLIIFYTGKIISVGCKTVEDLAYLFEQINKII